jgi:predicted DNA-binding transcriptional regulator YafY
MTNIETITGAIERGHLLSFDYKDSRRSVQPYIFGYDEKGTLILSAVQVSGGSGSGFRTFVLDDMENVEETASRFGKSHPDYNPRDRLFARILCQV